MALHCLQVETLMLQTRQDQEPSECTLHQALWLYLKSMYLSFKWSIDLRNPALRGACTLGKLLVSTLYHLCPAGCP